MLLVQEYLKTHSLPDLAKEHGVYARFSTKNPKKFSLNYDMLETKDGDKLAEECRGLVLELCHDFTPRAFASDWIGETRILAYPFKRFYNHGQGYAAKIDWNTAKFFEKLDGTLCIVYYDDTLESWSVATRSVSDADVNLETGKTFTDLFKQAVESQYKCTFDVFCMRLRYEHTFMFELCTPENQIVVAHADYKVWLLGCRNNETLKEVSVVDPIGIPKVLPPFDVCPTFDLTFEKLLDFVADRDPSKYEGLVVCDDKFNRIKIKNLAYVALNKVRDKVAKSPRALLELILMEKADDVKHLLPKEFQDRIEALTQKLSNWRYYVEDVAHDLLPSFVSRKEVALEIQRRNLNMGVMMHIIYKDGLTKGWFDLNKNEDGSFPDRFLDNLISMISQENPYSNETFNY